MLVSARRLGQRGSRAPVDTSSSVAPHQRVLRTVAAHGLGIGSSDARLPGSVPVNAALFPRTGVQAWPHDSSARRVNSLGAASRRRSTTFSGSCLAIVVLVVARSLSAPYCGPDGSFVP